MTSNVVSLDTLDSASFPSTCQAEVVGAFSTNVRIAEMLIQVLWAGTAVRAAFPLALDVVAHISTLVINGTIRHAGIAPDADIMHVNRVMRHGRSDGVKR